MTSLEPATAGRQLAAAIPILAVEELSVSYLGLRERVAALRNIDLTVARGEHVAIVGESGSGKSTLALAIAGLLTGPHVECCASRMEFNGQPIDLAHQSRLPRLPPGVAMVFQDALTSLDPVWTIESQLLAVIRAHVKVRRAQARDQARNWLRRVGLSDTERVLRARPYELSGGMQQRAMIAIALCAKPELLIADEPTSAIDAVLSRELMELLFELGNELGTTILMVSHDIALCREYADRIVIMTDGYIVEQHASATIEESARHPYTIGLLRCVPTLDSMGLERLPTMADMQPRLSAGACDARPQ
jgi:ABC-type dipeptide/oligopeptide/nickel transport system ATPase component